MSQPEHFIQIVCSFPEHPKVHQLAEALGCHPITAMGVLAALWTRAMRHCPSGDVTDVSEAALRIWCLGMKRISWPVFVAVGLVDEANGRRRLHGWEERYADKEFQRRRNAENQRRSRARRRHGDTGDMSPVTVTDSVTVSPVTSVTCHRAEGEGEGERTTHPPSPTVTVTSGEQLFSAPSGPRREGKDRAHPTKPQVPTANRDDAEWERAFAAMDAGVAAQVPTADDLRAAWNAIARELALPEALPLGATAAAAKRRAAANARIAEGILDPERWSAICAALRSSSFHRGGGPRGWRADFAWLLTADGATKLLERASATGSAANRDDAEWERAFAANGITADHGRGGAA